MAAGGGVRWMNTAGWLMLGLAGCGFSPQEVCTHEHSLMKKWALEHGAREQDLRGPKAEESWKTCVAVFSEMRERAPGDYKRCAHCLVDAATYPERSTGAEGPACARRYGTRRARPTI